MNFKLEHLEQAFSEELLLQAEVLLDQHAVRSPEEIDRHLWMSRVEDAGTTYEVEVQISPAKVLAGSCECSDFRKDRTCAHFVAVLLLLRKKKQQQKAERRQKVKAPQPKSVNIGNLLKAVPANDLSQFVRDFARGNRNFALSLKIRFSDQLELQDVDRKYQNIMRSLRSMLRAGKNGFTGQSNQLWIQFSREIIYQQEQLHLKKNFREQLALATAWLDLSFSVYALLSPRHQETQMAYWHQCLKLMERTLSPTLAPALRLYLIDHFYETFEQIPTRDHPGLELYLAFGTQLFKEKKHRLWWVETTLDWLSEVPIQWAVAQQAVIGMLWHSYKKQWPEIKVVLEKELDGQGAVLMSLLQQLMDMEAYELVNRLLGLGQNMNLSSGWRKKLNALRLELARKQGATDQERDLLRARLLDEYDFKYYHALQQLETEHPSFDTPDILSDLESADGQWPVRRLIIQILVANNDQKKLIEQLSSWNNLDAYDFSAAALLPDQASVLQAGYEAALEAYLSAHLGQKPSDRVQQSLHLLRQLKAYRLADQLRDYVLNNFPHRSSLAETLSFT